MEAEKPLETEQQKFLEIEKKHKDVDTRKIRLEEQFKNSKQIVADLVKKIKEEGVDPNNLKQVIQEEEKKVQEKLAAYEKELADVSSKLEEIEA